MLRRKHAGAQRLAELAEACKRLGLPLAFQRVEQFLGGLGRIAKFIPLAFARAAYQPAAASSSDSGKPSGC